MSAAAPPEDPMLAGTGMSRCKRKKRCEPSECEFCKTADSLPIDKRIGASSGRRPGHPFRFCLQRREAGVLWEDSTWLVLRKPPPSGVVGHLQLIAKRHVLGAADFDHDEAISFGTTLQRCEQVLKKVTACDQVNTVMLGTGGHFHAELLPLFDDDFIFRNDDDGGIELADQQIRSVTGTRFDPFLQEKLARDGVPGAEVSEEICMRVSTLFADKMRDEDRRIADEVHCEDCRRKMRRG